MAEVVILSLGDGDSDGNGRKGCGESCGCGGEPAARVPVLACADALRDAGWRAQLTTASNDADIDAALKPVEAGDSRLIIAAACDGEVRAVVRRLVRRYAPPPSRRSTNLPPNRTVFDLPPLGLLPLTPAVPDLVRRLGLPLDPPAVATAAVAGRERRLDLLRNDGGSVTLHGSLLGGVDQDGHASAWRGRVEVDDALLSAGDEPLLACSIRNAGASDMDGLPLIAQAQPDDGAVDVAVAVPVLKRHLLRQADVRYEVRRARGRAVSVTPAAGEVRLVDDGVAAKLTRKRSWWVEPLAWSVYVM